MLICMYAFAHHTAWALRCLFLAFEVMREPRCAEQVTGQFPHAFYLISTFYLFSCYFYLVFLTVLYGSSLVKLHKNVKKEDILLHKNERIPKFAT